MKEKNENNNADIFIADKLNFAAKEAYNLLRTNLEFSIPKKECGKVIGITSTLPQDGKSYTSINLAYSFAKNNYKVLLVDADLRRSSIAKTVVIEQTPGLSNFLSSGIEGCIKPSGLDEKFFICTAGDAPPNPSELLGSEKMASLMEKIVKEYDYVIIDLPPVLSVSDAAVMSKYMDGIVIVVRHNKTRRRELNDAIRQISFTGVKILGFVYNGFYTGGSYYRYKYNKQGQYGYYSKTDK